MKMNDKIGAVVISPCKKYITVGVKQQINIYQIRKGSALVLVKNFADLKVGNIVQLCSYEGVGPRICFVD